MGEPRNNAIRGVKLVVLSLFPTVLLLAIAETCSTLAIQRAVAVETDDRGQRHYKMRVGRLPWSRESSIRLNSSGFPAIEFDSIGAKGECKHIVFLGDSFVFGDGVDGDSSFVSVFAQRSRDRNPRACVRVFNLGARGTTIDKQTQNLNQHITSLKPDVVILGQYQNDLTDLTFSRHEQARQSASGASWQSTRDRFRTLNFNVVRFASYHMFSFAIQRGLHYDALRHWSVLADTQRSGLAEQLKTEYATQFIALKKGLAERGIGLAVMTLPSKLDLLAGRFPEEEFFRTLAHTAQVPYLPMFPVLNSNRKPNPFLMYDGHLNERGNRLVAEAVYDWLYATDPAPYAELRGDSLRAQPAPDPTQHLEN
jgi:lysophospholipase L1-like esterase